MNVGGQGRVKMSDARRWSTVIVMGALLGAFAVLMGCDYESSLDGLQCADDDECPEGAMCDDGICVEAPGLQHVALTPDEPIVVEQGETFSVQAWVYDDTGEFFGGDVHYEWSVVGDEELLSLEDTTGTVGGGVEEAAFVAQEKAGTALLRVEVEGLRASLPVTVSEVEVSDVVLEAGDGIEVDDDRAWSIEEGGQGRIEAQVMGIRDGQMVELEHRHVQWESSDPSVLKVDSNGVVYAERTASSPVEITASAGAEDVSETVEIEVRDRRIDQVAIIPGDLQMTAGHQISLSAKAFSDGERVDRAMDEFDWTVDGQGVADVEEGEDEVIVTADADLGGDDLRTATVTASLDEGEDVIEIRVVEQLEDGINISPSVMELREGQTARLGGTVVADGVIQTGAELEWSIDDGTDVLAIVGDETGEDVEVEALAPGQATVRADKPGSGLSAATADVTVEAAPIIALSIKPSFVELVLGPDTEDVEIELTTLAEQTLDAADIAANPDIGEEDIEFDVGAVVDLERTGTATATLETANEVGSTELTVTFPDYGVEDSIGVVVAPQAVESVTIDQDDLSMTKGQDESLSATVTPDIIDYADQILWWSDEQSVVTVGDGGPTQGSNVDIEAVGEGEATITAFLDGQSDSIVVTVEVTFDVEGDDNVDVGDTVSLEALYDGTDVSSEATWESDDSAIATVDQQGQVTGVDEGTATITATYEGREASMTITVDNPYEVVIDDEIEDAMAIGDTETLSATVYKDGSPSSCYDGEIEWSTTNSDAVDVDSDGVVYAESEGSAEIVAHCGVVDSEPLTVVVNAPQITILDAPFEVPLGDEKPVSAQIDYQGTCEPEWISDQSDVVGVESSGLNATLHGLAETDTPVQVTLHCGGEQASADVTVTNPYDVQIATYESQMEVGDVAQFAQQSTANACPSDILEWSSENTDVATVDDDGVVTAVKAGETEITAHCGEKRDSVDVEVYELSSVEIVQDDQTLDVGETTNLEVDVEYDGPETYFDECTPQWMTDDENVATVDGGASASGHSVVLEGHSVDETRVSVECGGMGDSIEVTVEEYGEEISITSPQEGFRMEVGQTETFEAEVGGGDAADNCDVELEWDSNDTNVATVDPDGVVEAVGGHELTATITVWCGAESDDLEVEVISEPDTVEIVCDDEAEADGYCEPDGHPQYDFDLDRENGALDVVVEYDGEEFTGCTPSWSAEATDGGQVEINQDGEIDATDDAEEAEITVSCGAEDDTVSVRLQ